MSEYEAKKFNVGDEVIVTKPHFDDKDCKKGHVYKIKGKTTNVDREECYELAGSHHAWFDDELEIVEPFRFEEGDIVKLNPDARLGDFARSKKNRVFVYSGTRKMFNEWSFSFNSEYVISNVSTIGIELEGFDGAFESALFTLVRRPEKVKEITMSELEKHYGCKVKIVKGDEE